MSKFIRVSCARFAVRLALTGVAAGTLAGCSTSERLSDPLSNPFQTSANIGNPGPAAGVVASAPVGSVQSRPLGMPTASNAALSPPAARIAVTPTPSHAGQSIAGWSAQGGSPVVVAQGENAQILANRYGVPLDAILRANGFANAAQVKPGARVVIPVYNAALATSSGVQPASTRNPSPSNKAADARPSGKGAAPTSRVGLLTAPPSRTSGKLEPKPLAPAASPKAERLAQTKPAQEPIKAENSKVAKVETPAAAEEPARASATESANPEFRWPARGRIIQAFKPGGNDGINIAVPEGTSVKAAESGVVAYAGNELKGYGNLILIRHPNGFVSAYANNGDIEVKRGETVKRGQTIAKSGQSGNVASPQLHFELRKGTTPVDPTQYLAGV
ncbi:peptidase M23 [Beijerinckiaceae bacterium]|nr:peptidase M23 [Beijerinckiaceae bacterium]